MINIIVPSRYKINRKLTRAFAQQTLEQMSAKNPFDLNLVFVGKNKMRMISQRYKNENVALPVLSFYYPDQQLGEIIICYPQAVLLAAQRNKTVDQTLIQLLKHGITNLVRR
ncbi:rRNA maturation RNAse YbeY [Patescibacteria group bacterium]|nr:rRNA maturation RNAse YbeY [Patescibacteria group bacterium]MCL5091825.1 rRNA maturation RNAse YbeY [Patescibacteria group bacterium]